MDKMITIKTKHNHLFVKYEHLKKMSVEYSDISGWVVVIHLNENGKSLLMGTRIQLDSDVIRVKVEKEEALDAIEKCSKKEDVFLLIE